MENLLYKNESYAIRGAIYDVHNHLGHGFLESVYQEALEKEFTLREIPFFPQLELNIKYKDYTLDKYFRVDFLCYGKIVVEIKSQKRTTTADQAQLLNYLKASGCSLGFLVNFGTYPKATIERMVFTPQAPNISEIRAISGETPQNTHPPNPRHPW
ncbi:MAG: GxxExxY protein [Spirochaetales bacterium]|nr:GxxExxY protein [Spirochaetales bacterium]